MTATRTPRQAVLALVDGHLEWVLAHRAEARFMYQAMSLGVAAPRAAALAATKAALLAPVVAHLARFIAAGTLPRWSPLAFDVVLLGPSHEACRRYLDGAALDPAWMRAQLPALAWRSVRVTAPSDVSPRRARGRSSRRAL